jgi:hypothetical protein
MAAATLGSTGSTTSALDDWTALVVRIEDQPLCVDQGEVTVTAAAPVPPRPPIPSDPESIRATLTATLRGEFDREWELVLDQAKESRQIGPILGLVNKWRHIAAGELEEPGRYYRVLAKAEQILRTGHNPDGRPIEGLTALIAERIGR